MMLRFRFADFERDLEAILELASPLLQPQGQASLEGFKSRLKTCQAQTGVLNWVIDRGDPVVTLPTEGDHDRGSGWPANLYAALSTIWTIEPQGKSGAANEFRLAGKASTLVEFHDLDEPHAEQPLAVWRMEIGNVVNDVKSPGCFFHVQLGREGRAEWPFPHHLCVPRLPSFMMTPQAALAFTLGELFETKWPERLARNSGPLGVWASFQAKCMQATLQWFQQIVEANKIGTPLTSIKGGKPPEDLFLQ